ncbi:50S ribosomal protein L25 [uncultured Clostridium sp.]|uniref:50S ribosomal protein L25 n=1 Tax=uncultured Clostridium sp. TaxID=59620 RepID=UPI00321681AA
MKSTTYKVYERSSKENLKNLRKLGAVPCVIYGEFLEEPISAKMNKTELMKMLKVSYSGSIIPIDLEGKTLNCVVKDIQKNNLHEIIHFDLQYVKPNEVIKLTIPINYIGQENLESKRLVLETFRPYLDFQGNVEKIPEYIEVNVANMKFNDKLLAKDINIPSEVTLLTPEETILAVVNG